jgi:hypothetical protein
MMRKRVLHGVPGVAFRRLLAVLGLIAVPAAILSCAGSDSPTDPTPPTDPPASSAPTITTANLPNGTVSQAYSQTLAATGGDGSYSWSVSSGSLPSGLSLNVDRQDRSAELTRFPATDEER